MGNSHQVTDPVFSLSGSQNSPRGVLPALRLQSPGDGCLLAMDGRICVGCRCRCVRPIRLGWSPAKARWRLPHNGNGPRGHNFEPPHSFEAKRNREFASEPVGGSTTIAGGFGAAGCTQRDRPFPDADGGLHPSAWFGGLGTVALPKTGWRCSSRGSAGEFPRARLVDRGDASISNANTIEILPDQPAIETIKPRIECGDLRRHDREADLNLGAAQAHSHALLDVRNVKLHRGDVGMDRPQVLQIVCHTLSL